LNLLEHDRAQEVRVVLGLGRSKKALCHPDNVVPEGFPLVLFVPNVRPLKERHN
jgi:hypothetical protein